MLRSATFLLAIFFGLSIHSATFADPHVPGQFGNSPILTPKISEAPHRKKLSPGSWLNRLLQQSELYEYMLQHPDFVKIQGIVTTFWKHQTFGKRRFSTNAKSNRLLIRVQ